MDARLPSGLSGSHFFVLNHLIRVQDGRTPLDLARAFQVPKTTMTHTLSGLEARRLVDMRPNPKDGRSKCAWLTKKGRSFRDEAIASLEPDLVKFLARFPKRHIETLVSHLAEIRETMDANRNENN